MNILLAIDGSDCSQAATEKLAMLLTDKTKVHIVSAYNSATIVSVLPKSQGVPQGTYQDVEYLAKMSAEKIVRDACGYLNKKTPKSVITTSVIDGTPKEAILDEAEKNEVDLIVMGSHGRGAIGRFLIGSVSQAITLHAKCSVMIVRDY